MISTDAAPTALDSLLDSVARCFDPQTARAIADLRQSETVRERMRILGNKSADGNLTPAEKHEYEALVEVGDVVATLQLKARQRIEATATRQ